MAAGAGFRELTIDIGYGHIACKVWGENILATQKFLAVHGWLDNAGTFDPLMEYFLNNDRCVVCLDLPGHGLSSHLPKGVVYNAERYFYAMRCVIRHLGWKKYSLIGHSLGATRCQTYAMLWPEEIETIISYDGFIQPSEIEHNDLYKVYEDGNCETDFVTLSERFNRFIDYTNRPNRKEREHTWEELADRWLKAVPGLTLPDFQVLMRRGAKKLDNGKYIYTRDTALHARLLTVMRYPMMTIIHRIQRMRGIPQIVITNGDYNFPRGKGVQKLGFLIRTIANSYPDKYEIFKVDGGHHFVMQRPKLACHIANDFLKRNSGDKPRSKL